MATVAELIEQLSQYDPNLPVCYNDASYGWTELRLANTTNIPTNDLRPDQPTTNIDVVELTWERNDATD